MRKLIAEPIFIFLSVLASLWVDGYTDEIKEKDYQSFDGPAKFIKDIPEGWKTFNLFNEGVIKGKPSSTGITLLQKKV